MLSEVFPSLLVLIYYIHVFLGGRFKCRTILHHCLGLVKCSRLSSESWIMCRLHMKIEYRPCASGDIGVWHPLLQLINTFNTTEAAIFSIQAMLPEVFSFTASVKCLCCGFKCRHVLHHCVVIIFWSSAIMDCMLITFKEIVPLVRLGRQWCVNRLTASIRLIFTHVVYDSGGLSFFPDKWIILKSSIPMWIFIIKSFKVFCVTSNPC